MTTSQYFVYKRPIAWTLLIFTMLWGIYAYRSMPQRQDPLIQVRSGVVLTLYPGASALEVEQEVSRKIEKVMTENPAVEHVRSVSQQGQSIVFIDLYDTIKNAEPIWQDLNNKLEAITTLPAVAGQALRPKLNKDFGDTVATMLTLSSPPVSDFEVEQRAGSISRKLAEARASRPEPLRDRRYSGILVYPSSVSADFIERLARSALRHLVEKGLAEDGQYLAMLGAGVVDFQLVAGTDEATLRRALERWELEALGAGLGHPDVWPGILVRDPCELAGEMKMRVQEEPGGVARYTYEDLRRFADLIQDRLRQSPKVGKIEQIGVQEQAVFLYFSHRRLSGLGIEPMALAGQLAARNINMPGGSVQLPEQTLVVKPSGPYRAEREIGETVIDVRDGYPLYLRDLAEVVRGYEDPARTLNFRTVKCDIGHSPTALDAPSPGSGSESLHEHEDNEELPASLLKLWTTRRHPGGLPRQRDADRRVRPGRREDARLAQGGPARRLAGRAHQRRAARGPPEDRPVQGLPDRSDRDRGRGGPPVHGVAERLARGPVDPDHGGDDPWVLRRAGDRHPADLDRRPDHRAGPARRRPGRGRGRDQPGAGPRDAARRGGLARPAEALAGDPLRHPDEHRRLPPVADRRRGRRGVYLLAADRGDGLAGGQPDRVDDLHPAARLLHAPGPEGARGRHGGGGGGKGSRFARIYNGFSERCMEHKWAALASCLAVLLAAMSLIPKIGTNFFPKDLHNTFTVNLFLPEGTPIRQTKAEAMKAIAAIDKLAGPEIEAYTTFVGAGGPRFWLSVVPEQPASNYTQILVHTRDAFGTAALAGRLKRELPPSFAAARVTVEQLESGPPIGVPVQIRLQGPELATLRRLGDEVKSLMRDASGTENIHDDWDPESLQVNLHVATDRANMSGITNQDVALMTSAGLSGYTATTLRERDRQVPVILRFRPDERSRMEDMKTLQIFGARTGTRVPLEQVGSFKTEMVTPKIGRRDNERCLTVKCDTVPGVLPSRVADILESKLGEASKSWPPGYRFAFGGEKEEQAKGFAFMTVAMVASILGIYLALVLQFNSLTKPLLVFAAVPFGMIGGLMGLLIFNVPLGFFAMLGLSSLAGVIISHVIVLFEYIEEAHERGEPLRRAVIDAALVRLRPVLVTVLATVGGLVPLAMKGGPLWEPLCCVQIIGLLVATLVTKVVVPVLYVLFVEDFKLIKWAAPGEHVAEGPPAEYVNMSLHGHREAHPALAHPSA